MSGSGSRMTRSASIDEGQVSITPEDEFKMLARFMSEAEAADNDEERQEETTDNPTNSIEDIGESAGELAQQIVSTLTGSAQDVIGLFQEIVSSVGDVLKDVSRFIVIKNRLSNYAIISLDPAPEYLAIPLHCNLVPPPRRTLYRDKMCCMHSGRHERVRRLQEDRKRCQP